MDRDIMDLARKNGADFMEMPTPVGKTLGDLMPHDLVRLQREMERAKALLDDYHAGKRLSAADRKWFAEYLRRDQLCEAAKLKWALAAKKKKRSKVSTSRKPVVLSSDNSAVDHSSREFSQRPRRHADGHARRKTSLANRA